MPGYQLISTLSRDGILFEGLWCPVWLFKPRRGQVNGSSQRGAQVETKPADLHTSLEDVIQVHWGGGSLPIDYSLVLSLSPYITEQEADSSIMSDSVYTWLAEP